MEFILSTQSENNLGCSTKEILFNYARVLNLEVKLKKYTWYNVFIKNCLISQTPLAMKLSNGRFQNISNII